MSSEKGPKYIYAQETNCITIIIIIHQTHYEKSNLSRAFNQFTIACELDMINVISAADITFIMSSSTSAWLISPLECSQKQNGWKLRFCFWGWIMWKMYNKTIIEFGFRMISWIIKPSCLRLRQITQISALIIHDIMLSQPHNCLLFGGCDVSPDRPYVIRLTSINLKKAPKIFLI